MNNMQSHIFCSLVVQIWNFSILHMIWYEMTLFPYTYHIYNCIRYWYHWIMKLKRSQMQIIMKVIVIKKFIIYCWMLLKSSLKLYPRKKWFWIVIQLLEQGILNIMPHHTTSIILVVTDVMSSAGNETKLMHLLLTC